MFVFFLLLVLVMLVFQNNFIWFCSLARQVNSFSLLAITTLIFWTCLVFDSDDLEMAPNFLSLIYLTFFLQDCSEAWCCSSRYWNSGAHKSQAFSQAEFGFHLVQQNSWSGGQRRTSINEREFLVMFRKWKCSSKI